MKFRDFSEDTQDVILSEVIDNITKMNYREEIARDYFYQTGNMAFEVDTEDGHLDVSIEFEYLVEKQTYYNPRYERYQLDIVINGEDVEDGEDSGIADIIDECLKDRD